MHSEYFSIIFNVKKCALYSITYSRELLFSHFLFQIAGQVDPDHGRDEEGGVAAAEGLAAGEGEGEGPQDGAGESAQRSPVEKTGGQRPADLGVNQEDPVLAAAFDREEGGPGVNVINLFYGR